MSKKPLWKKVEMDLTNFSTGLEYSKGIRKKVRQENKNRQIPYPTISYDYENLLPKIINDVGVNYDFLNFHKNAELFRERAGNFREIAFNLDKMENLVSQKSLDDEMLYFVELSFYASNFDTLINFLKPICTVA